MRIRRNVALAMLTMTLAASVGTASAGPGSVTPIDPCSLLTKADARAILGEPVTDGRRTTETGFTPDHKCTYITSAPLEKRGAVYSVSVAVMDEATFRKQGSYFKSPKQDFYRTRKGQLAVKKPNQTLDIGGVGDAAMWLDGTQVLYVLSGDVYFIVSVDADFHIPPGPGEKVDAEVKAARLKAEKHLANSIILPRLRKLH